MTIVGQYKRLPERVPFLSAVILLTERPPGDQRPLQGKWQKSVPRAMFSLSGYNGLRPCAVVRHANLIGLRHLLDSTHGYERTLPCCTTFGCLLSASSSALLRG